jgi:hypothetical protein
MRDIKKIWDIWRSGIYLGDTRPSTRVTVEPSFFLTPTGPVVGQWERGPARWFQRTDITKQIETEIPGVLNVTINRSTEPDAGTCDFSIRNTVMPTLADPEVVAGQFGLPGYYTPDRGESQEAAARWGHATNPWHGILVPNALIRTYQGFGGQDKTVRDAVADGDIVLNGIWLVDDVTTNTDGTISVKCRDMAKLLIDQQLVPPLVPQELYPLTYQRYRVEDYPIPADPPPGVDVACPNTYYPLGPDFHASSDVAYGAWNAADTGHPPTDAYDISFEPGPAVPGAFAHQRTFWLSEPQASPSGSVWLEMDIDNGGLPINEIYVHPWRGWMEGKGFFRVMVSVMEWGNWAVEFPGFGADPGITPQGLPYVTTLTAGTEEPSSNRFPLPRDYAATRIRLTFTNLIWADGDAPLGGFRAGARKLMACYNPQRTMYPPLSFAAASLPGNDDNRTGYWQTRETGRIFAFGDARTYQPENGMAHVSRLIGMAVHPSGNGYWTIDVAGRILAYGAAHWYGDPVYNVTALAKWSDVAPTPSGNGYWALRSDGVVIAYGDAQHYGNGSHTNINPDGTPTGAQSLESHPTDQGYWILWQDGVVESFNLTNYGNADRNGFAPLEWTTALRRTRTGAGYWILSGLGIVQARGDAVHYGNAGADFSWDAANWYRPLCWELIPTPTGGGYMIQRLDGAIGGCGAYDYFGSIASGAGELRYDGNYKDYSDIIRDLLLWAGFYFYKDPQPQGELPEVYGNIETTGAYSTEDPLPNDMFDKRPVLDAIRDIKAIVGYVFFIDAEGGARFEAPNWWQMGNFLLDGTPFPYMPEVDERVNLTSHSVVRSDTAARSEIIVASEYPYSTVTGQPPPDGIIKTRITGSSAADLKGIISPVFVSTGQFLNQKEQQTMAELVDMQIWFQRRTANIQCVANPLIDVNDQVRIIERQTGDVYVHYVKAISFSHDLNSGQYTMTLTTHWLGGTPYGQLRLFYACAAQPSGEGYWQISAAGDVYAFGGADLYDRHEADTHLSWPIAMRSTPSGNGYWTLDQNGKILSYGDAVNYGDLLRQTKDAIDLAITPSGGGYWILLRNGEVHSFGDAVFEGQQVTGAPARSIDAHPSTMGYWVLYTDGTVVGFNVAHHGDADRLGFKPSEIVTRLRATPSGNGYWTVSSSGLVQAFGDAPDLGSGIVYPDGPQGLVWDLLVGPSGYGIQRAEGTFEMFDFTDQGLARTSSFELSWALVTADTYQAQGRPTQAHAVSAQLVEFLKKTGSPSANNAAANGFNSPSSAALDGSSVS